MTGRMRPPFALLLALFLPACAASSPHERADVAFIAPGVQFVTPGPEELGYRINAVQLVIARYGAEQFVFEGHISAAPDRLTLVALDAFGRRALTATRSRDEVVFEPADWLPSSLRAANILADMAIVYWPEEAIRRALVGTAATLETHAGERRIVVGGNELIRVSYETGAGSPWTGVAHYRNAAFGYDLDLRSRVMP